MKMNKSFLVHCLVTASLSIPFCTKAATQQPSNDIVKESAFACVGMAHKYGSDGRRFDYENVKTFISSQVDDCVRLLSFSLVNKTTGKDILDNIESEWATTYYDVTDEEYSFYGEFHENLMSGAQKAAENHDYLNEMVLFGKSAANGHH
ncbi:hypothetical protein OGY07_19035 [Citrobacter sp. Cs237]|uniref:hypothetical protein n=1 Tax=Citrobacter sp. Cs237 TaxID=2985156 RepID=UPI00257769EA|nr:hypothetical protein [Citrobacter sp. Cs237]MDM2751422.1 hypothetical protein [Citrobacter sp. Cs237]